MGDPRKDFLINSIVNICVKQSNGQAVELANEHHLDQFLDDPFCTTLRAVVDDDRKVLLLIGDESPQALQTNGVAFVKTSV